jgi:hypothetical protein
MKTLYEESVRKDTISRINRITPDTNPGWGEMDASQMMEHSSRTFAFATGKTKPARTILGYMMGPFYYNDKLFGQNSPTADSFKVNGVYEFDATKKRLIQLVTELQLGGPLKATTHPSPFYGRLSPEQHGYGQFKHIDHHLKQFGV